MGVDDWGFYSDWLDVLFHKSPKAGKGGGVWHRRNCYYRSDSRPSDRAAEKDQAESVVGNGTRLPRRSMCSSLAATDRNYFRSKGGFRGRPNHDGNLLHYYRPPIKEAISLIR